MSNSKECQEVRWCPICQKATGGFVEKPQYEICFCKNCKLKNDCFIRSDCKDYSDKRVYDIRPCWDCWEAVCFKKKY